MDEVENVRGLEAIKEKMEMPKPQPIEKRERRNRFLTWTTKMKAEKQDRMERARGK